MKNNKLFSVILSIAVAFGLWIYVITVISPGSSETYYNIPVVRIGESVLAERGLIITSISSTAVDMELSGNRTDLVKVNSSNITLKADLSKIYDPGVHKIEYSHSFPGDIASNAFTIENKYPENITVTVERLIRKEVPVNVVYEGSVPEGFITDKDNVVKEYETVTVQGPKSVVDQITQAVINVSLTDQKESISQSYRYTLCNKDSVPVDANLITTNTEEVHLDLIIHRIKDVKLVVNIVDGGGAKADNIKYTLDPDTIKVSGSDAALENLGDEILLGTVNLKDYAKNAKIPLVIPEYEGVTNLSNITEVTMDLEFIGLSTKEFVLDQFRLTGIPEGLTAEVITEQITVVIRGRTADVSKLTAQDITVTVDFTEAVAGTSTYRVTITFSEGFTELGALGSYSISVTLTEAEE